MQHVITPGPCQGVGHGEERRREFQKRSASWHRISTMVDARSSAARCAGSLRLRDILYAPRTWRNVVMSEITEMTYGPWPASLIFGTMIKEKDTRYRTFGLT